MARVKPEFKSKFIVAQAQALKDVRYKHLGQQVTFLGNALRKMEQDVQGLAGTRKMVKRIASIERIVGKLLKGQGIEHPAVDLLLEKEPREFTTNESAAATEQD